MVQIPDLLHADPRRSIDVDQADTALVFAFAGSSSVGLFAELLNGARAARSTFEPAGFARDLFVTDFVRSCFVVRVAGKPVQPAFAHLVRTLCAPPAAQEHVEFRREIVAELLASSDLRAELQGAYEALCRFRSLLESHDIADRLDPSRRQLELLSVFQKTIQRLSGGFANCRSGLRRLHDFAARVEGSEEFAALCDLLRYDDRLATLSFKVDIGADGRVRRLELVSVAEASENQFSQSPLRRWLSKLELFARGFRFGDGEVMARLLDAVFDGVRPELPALVQLLGDLEFYLGALGFRDKALAAGLEVSLPRFVGSAEPRQLEGAFNPLLLGMGISPVPCDLSTDRHDVTLLITGPNSGGKTRLLQTLGLTQLLAQSGLFVPAKRAQLSVVPNLVVSLIQETSADQTEGRLGVELVRIRSLFEQLPPRAMVILDELCSGTNPSEGEEIFELVIRSLALLSPQSFITTHFLSFAARLEREAQLTQLRFVQVELGPGHEPTYQFAPGVAHTSLAGRAAARLGVTGDQLLGLIERNVRRHEAKP
ncbi:MAG TPA: DNA mismatch repair protein [Polyangiaceae bacterium]|nr:DNA mismatch repair protein [Polyangiaceae bacterium]